MATIKPTTVPSKRLAASIDASAATIQLNNITGWNGSDLTASDFGTKLYAVLRNDTNTLMELIELDPSTIASASITILRRGLSFDGDLTTELTARKLTWVKNETIVEIGSNPPQLYKHFVDIVGDQTIDGVKTLSSFPIKSGSTTPSSSTEFATKAYVDSIVAGTVNYDRQTVSGTAGENVTAGQIVYFKTSDQKWWKTDADAAATAQGVKIGIAQGNILANASGTFLIGGLDSNQTGLSAGSIYFLSGTAASLATTPGTFRRFVGVAVSTTSIFFDPENSGVEDVESYGADAGSNDTYVVTVPRTIGAYRAGMVIRFKAGTRNTGACTINVNSVGAASIKKEVNLDPSDGDIEAGGIYTLVHDGTNFQILNPKGAVPTGAVMMWIGATAPAGWLLCDASAVSRTTYATLYAVVGDTYGNGNGSSTFNVPDMRGRVPVGVGTGVGDGTSGTGLPTGTSMTQVGLATWKGAQTHVLITAELAAHSHDVTGGQASGGGGTGGYLPGLGGAQGSASAAATTTGSNAPHNNIQPVMGINFIIKI